jgi:hypothetical protein
VVEKLGLTLIGHPVSGTTPEPFGKYVVQSEGTGIWVSKNSMRYRALYLAIASKTQASKQRRPPRAGIDL